MALTKHYLGFSGSRTDWKPTTKPMRDIVPENRKRIYEVRDAITTLADVDSTLELRPNFGKAIVTTLARIEGRPVGIIANDPGHLGGAIDADSADKGARFMQLCDAHGLPMISLCDTRASWSAPRPSRPHKSALRPHVRRRASLTVPFVTVILRKAVGLGAMAMSAGSMHSTLLSVAWPTGEVSGMGIEGAVKHGARRELDAIDDLDDREARYDELVERMYDASKALNAAAHGEIDDVIDPADTRRRVRRCFVVRHKHRGRGDRWSTRGEGYAVAARNAST